MSDLVVFLRARLGEDETAAKAADGPDWFLDSAEDSDQRSIRYTGPSTLRPGELADYYVADRVDEHDAAHIARHDPARVLREVEAKRAILARYEDTLVRQEDPDYPAGVARDQAREYEDFVLPNLAAVYRDHPDYDPDWAP